MANWRAALDSIASGRQPQGGPIPEIQGFSFEARGIGDQARVVVVFGKLPTRPAMTELR